MTGLLGTEDTPMVGSPLAQHDAYLLWLRGQKAAGRDVDRHIALAEFERALTVWLRDPNKDEGEDYDAVVARLKAEITAKMAA